MTALLPAGLAFLMLVVGLRLAAADFRALWQRPVAVIAGLIAQMAALPLLALLIASGLSLPPALALGLLVVAAAPGGITSNFITLLARGDVALSTTMTLFTSLAAAITIPLVLVLAGNPIDGGASALALGIGRTGIAVLLVSATPLLLGMAIRNWSPVFAARWTPLLGRAATLIFFALVVAAFRQNWDAMLAYGSEAVIAASLLNLGGIAAGLLAGAVARLPARQSLAIAIECGLQNVAMAMFVASTVLHDQSLMIPALIYAVVMNVSALGLLVLGRLALASQVEAVQPAKA